MNNKKYIKGGDRMHDEWYLLRGMEHMIEL
jgi:hypothetical protein